MALIKYQPDTLLIDSQNQDSAHVGDNKDFLLVSLLEKLCQNLDSKNHLFLSICQYLKDHGLLDNAQSYSKDTKMIREMYLDYLLRLINHFTSLSTNGNPELTLVDNDSDQQLFLNNGHGPSIYATNYVEIELLGSGGFGHVYRVYNKIDAHEYAIKMVPLKNNTHHQQYQILNEVRCLSSLNHHNIVRYYTSWIELSLFRTGSDSDSGNGSGSDDRSIIQSENSKNESKTKSLQLYDSDNLDDKQQRLCPILHIQMELCRCNLKHFLQQRNQTMKSGFLTNFDRESQMIRDLIQGMSYLHQQNILHRDLNPNNLFLDTNNMLKIGDFGLSIKVDNKSNTQIKMSPYLGVFLYMPPEYLEKNIYTDKSDIYSAGIIIFDLLYAYQTEMEHCHVIQNFRQNRSFPCTNACIDFELITSSALSSASSVSSMSSASFVSINQYLKLILMMTNPIFSQRPDFHQLI